MKIVSVILARGGSKGIPMKNIMRVNGHPLVYYAIKASQLSNVQETWVSTDNKEIAKVSRDLGAKILMRPEELAIDTSPSEDALLHFADNVEFDTLVFIQPTSPLLTSSYINIGLFKRKIFGYDSIFSVYAEKWQGRWAKGRNTVIPQYIPLNWNGLDRPRRQDAPLIYVENGAFYVTTKEFLLKSKNRYDGRIGIIEMPYLYSFQLDNLDDLFIIEAIMKGRI